MDKSSAALYRKTMARRDLLVATVIMVVGVGVAVGPRHAEAATIQATVTYAGNLGPVSGRRPLCLCVYLDADLQRDAGCYISSVNGVAFQVNAFSDTDYFLTAFLDLDENEGLSADEPYEIYRDRARPPADAITTGSGQSTIEITFGDENLPPAATHSPTPTSTVQPTSTATATPVETPLSSPCAGDCNGSGQVLINEIVTLVNIALERVPADECRNGETDHHNGIAINEIVAAVKSAVRGCPGQNEAPD